MPNVRLHVQRSRGPNTELHLTAKLPVHGNSENLMEEHTLMQGSSLPHGDFCKCVSKAFSSDKLNNIGDHSQSLY